MHRIDMIAEIIQIANCDLGDDEVEVLLEQAAALRDGRAVYGELKIAEDPRDFAVEALEEDRDWLVYRAADIVRQRRKLRAR